MFDGDPGAALCAGCLAQGWLRRLDGTRAVAVTPLGRAALGRCGEDVDDLALCHAPSGNGVVARPLGEMLHHPARERGLFLGFSARSEQEVTRGAEVIGRHPLRQT